MQICFLYINITVQTNIWDGIMHLKTCQTFYHDLITFYALIDKQFGTFSFFTKNNNLQIASRLKRICRQKKDIRCIIRSLLLSVARCTKMYCTHCTILDVFLESVALLNPCVAVYHSYL